jgi:hypothetical protein
MNKLKFFSTKDLYNELKNREGVKNILINPYKEYKIITSEEELNEIGPAAVLVIID